MNWLKVRKKPVVVEAFQLKKEMVTNAELDGLPIEGFLSSGNTVSFRVKTLEGTMVCETGDYVIKGVKGEYYPIKREIFEETYEVLE